MKSRHNITQDRPIVNATDDTSALFAAARTLAQPVCTAAASRGTMNARRSIRGGWCSMAVLIAFAAVMLAASVSPALASALTCDCDICVNTTGWWRDGGVLNTSATPIQAAADNATAGETVYVWNGSYTENVNINKRLTLEGEGVDVVTVTAASTSDHIFNVTADYVNISGFDMTGATGSFKAGVYLNSSQHCNISSNTASGNYYGICMFNSSNNTLTNNTANSNYDSIYLSSSNNNTLTNNTANSNNQQGIYLLSSSNNTLTNNTANLNNRGIFIKSSSDNNTLTNNTLNSNFRGIQIYITCSNNKITNNTAKSNSNRGIFITTSNGNTIYNNNFNNTNNAYDTAYNTWNITPTEGTNIIGGSWLGGNYWSDYVGVDLTGDGLGDTLLPYNSSGDIQNGGDYHPLVTPGFAAPNITSSAPGSPANDTYGNWTKFNVSVDQTVNVT